MPEARLGGRQARLAHAVPNHLLSLLLFSSMESGKLSLSFPELYRWPRDRALAKNISVEISWRGHVFLTKKAKFQEEGNPAFPSLFSFPLAYNVDVMCDHIMITSGAAAILQP